MEPTLRLQKISSRLGLAEVPAQVVGSENLSYWDECFHSMGKELHVTSTLIQKVRSTAPASHIYSSIILIEGTSEIGRTGPRPETAPQRELPSPPGLKKRGQLIGKPTDRAPKRPTNGGIKFYTFLIKGKASSFTTYTLKPCLE